MIGHYIHGEETDWIPRIRIILTHGKNLAFKPFGRFAQFQKSNGKSLNDLLDEFSVLRRKNLKILSEMNLSSEQLMLSGTHPELGNVTLEQLLSAWVVHDLNHIRQIVTDLAIRYSENVGVWKKYMAIVQ